MRRFDAVISRRNAIKGLGAVAGTALSGGLVFLDMSQPALAASGFTANNVNLSSVDGTIQDVFIAPQVELTWVEVGDTPTHVDFQFGISSDDSDLGGGSGVVKDVVLEKSDQSVDAGNQVPDGNQVFDYSSTAVSIISEHASLSASDFVADVDDSLTTYVMDLEVGATLKNTDGTSITQASAVTSFTVEVTNEPGGSTSLSGSANTDGTV